MIVRTWRTSIDEARASEYEQFAADISLPMFRSHDGFRGLVFGRDGAECLVITLWADQDAVDSFEKSPRYQQTVAEIVATGFIVGDSVTERFRVHGSVLGGD